MLTGDYITRKAEMRIKQRQTRFISIVMQLPYYSIFTPKKLDNTDHARTRSAIVLLFALGQAKGPSIMLSLFFLLSNRFNYDSPITHTSSPSVS